MPGQSNDPLPGVPRIDNPFFERIFSQLDTDPETRRIARDLYDKGYAILDFPDSDIGRLCEEIKAKHTPSRTEFDDWRAGRLDLRIQDAWRGDANVKRLAVNPKMLAVLETVFGRPAFPFQTLNFAVGSQQHVHSDSVHFASIPDGFMCGVWVALEDVDADNGPLLYSPGSHKWPRFYNEHIGVNAWHLPKRGTQYSQYEKLWDELIELHQAKPERLFAKKGQAVIWLAHLLHGGDKQNDQMRTRFSQVTHYYCSDCVYYTPMLSDPSYGNIFFRHLTNIITGKPVPQMAGGHKLPYWFVSQAMYHSPTGLIMHALSRIKRKIFNA